MLLSTLIRFIRSRDPHRLRSSALIRCSRMRRGIHIVFALALTLLLVRPFDCFAGLKSGKAADCCAKGKCLPTRDSDDCCKATLPADTQIIAAKVSCFASVPLLQLSAIALPAPIVPQTVQPVRIAEHLTAQPPGSPPGVHRNLPLLI